jgi:hypothetical protein
MNLSIKTQKNKKIKKILLKEIAKKRSFPEGNTCFSE